jgi:hypothetical protein
MASSVSPELTQSKKLSRCCRPALEFIRFAHTLAVTEFSIWTGVSGRKNFFSPDNPNRRRRRREMEAAPDCQRAIIVLGWPDF